MTSTRMILLAAVAAVGLSAASASGTAQTREPVRIGVVGAGWLGGTVGRAWVRAGHSVMFSSRNPEELRPMAEALGPRALVGTPKQAAAYGSVVLFAVPYDAMPQLGRDLQAELRGKVVLDATNPPPGSDNPLSREAESEGVGAVSQRLLPGTRLVRAFSAVDATAIEASELGRRETLGVPIAGDDDEAVQTAARLVRDAGSEPVIAGKLADAARFQRGSAAFRANTGPAELRRLIEPER